MIDLSNMKAIRVDPQAQTATAAGGVLLGEFDRATQSHGLATTGGVISHTGLAGLTLGGGLGHLMRKHGLTIDNLLAVDLVTADGELRHVTEQSDPDLFWGLRGGGGNFGIATRFDYQLHPIGPMILGGPILWPLEDAAEVMATVREVAPDAPDELGITVAIIPAPPAPFVPPDRFGRPTMALILVWTGDPADGAKAIEPLRKIGTPIADVVRPTPYVALQSMLDGGAPTAATTTGRPTSSRPSPTTSSTSSSAPWTQQRALSPRSTAGPSAAPSAASPTTPPRSVTAAKDLR